MTSKLDVARNLIAFWIFGLCNNYAYVVMLSAAQDILDVQENIVVNSSAADQKCLLCCSVEHDALVEGYRKINHKKKTEQEDDDLSVSGKTQEDCDHRRKMEEEADNLLVNPKVDKRLCKPISTGAVLLADIIPCFVVKFSFPFFMQRIPFGVRHMIVVVLQFCSYLVVAFSVNIPMSLLGVIFASMSSGLGEITYLALSPNYKNVISTWSSGTGGAGVLGAFSYAFLTEPHFANLTPSQATLVMLVIPVLFAAAYWWLLVVPDSVYQVGLHPKTWIVPRSHLAKSDSPVTDSVTDSTDSKTPVVNYDGRGTSDSTGTSNSTSTSNSVDTSNSAGTSDSADTTQSESPSTRDKFVKQRKLSFPEKMKAILPLLKYMIPIMLVYLGEYLINQGIVQLIIFDCDHGFDLSVESQYRWYQVIYQVGVFISRSSVDIVRLNYTLLVLLPILQITNVFIFLFESLYYFIPHIWILFSLILFEGIFGGASYVNTFQEIHDISPPDIREYAMSVSSLGDTIGICVAGFASIPLHNAICRTSLY